MPDQVLQNTLDVVVNGITYVFAIPDFASEIKLGLRERDIRRSLQVEMGEQVALGEPTGDNATEFLVRTAAQFELLLRKCSSEWPYSAGESGPVVDFRQWPSDKVDEACRVGVAFDAELRRFRNAGAANRNPAGTEAVAGQPDTGGQPV